MLVLDPCSSLLSSLVFLDKYFPHRSPHQFQVPQPRSFKQPGTESFANTAYSAKHRANHRAKFRRAASTVAAGNLKPRAPSPSKTRAVSKLRARACAPLARQVQALKLSAESWARGGGGLMGLVGLQTVIGLPGLLLLSPLLIVLILRLRSKSDCKFQEGGLAHLRSRCQRAVAVPWQLVARRETSLQATTQCLLLSTQGLQYPLIRLGFLPRSVWNKQTRIGPPSP